MNRKSRRQQQSVLQTLLRQAREEALLRQEDLALLLERPQSYVSKYESGERRLDVLEFLAICSALRVDAGEVITKLAEAPLEPPNET